MKTTHLIKAGVIALAALATPAWSNEDVIDAMQEYMKFSTYEAGIIVPQQITEDVFGDFLFVDTRNAEQFEQSTIPGAINIEWRDVLGRIDEIPTDKKVILFCNTGSLSSQAAFALRVAGRENVLLLQTGLIGWQANAAYKP